MFMNKNELKNKIINDEHDLDDIKSNFKNRDDSIKCNSIKIKLKMFEELVDKIDEKYYDKLYNELCDIEETILKLQTAEQDKI